MGFYASLSAGAAFDDSRLTYPGMSADVSHSASSGLLGGQIGYNYLVNSLVLGAEVEATWTALNRSGPCGNPIFICSTRDDWVAAATARAGYAFGQALFYGKGGVAFTSFDDHGDDDADPALNERNSTSRTGWTLGAGLEYALSLDIGRHWLNTITTTSATLS
jgi:outer membrane immunogenic protein